MQKRILQDRRKPVVNNTTGTLDLNEGEEIKRTKPLPTKRNWTSRPNELSELPLEQVRALLARGWTEAEVCRFYNLGEDTIREWKNEYDWFAKLCQDWRAEYDDIIEKRLAERAAGYRCREEKVFCYNGKIVTHEVTKQYPPDVAAASFWLSNRKPDAWGTAGRLGNGPGAQTNVMVNVNAGPRPISVDLSDFSEEELRVIASAGRKLLPSPRREGEEPYQLQRGRKESNNDDLVEYAEIG